ILIFALAMAAIGWERGLVGSALPLVGFVAGIAIAARAGPALLSEGSESPYAPAVAAAGGILLGLFLAIALEGAGEGLSDRLRARTHSRLVDALGGAVLLAALAFMAAWVFGAVALNAPGQGVRELRHAVQRSSILVALNDALPPSGFLLNALRRIDPTPAVKGPRADVAEPDRKLLRDPDVQAATQSVVRVQGSACGLGVEGSGWIAGPELVVTNAHVIAGQDDTQISTPDGQVLDAGPLHYEPRNDLAILSVPGLAGEALAVVDRPRRGTPGATIGYPEAGPLTVAAARLGGTGTVQSQDSYGRGPVERSMTPFRGEVRSGNSGGPVVDAQGNVLATVFASTLGGGPPSGLGVPNPIVAKALGGPLDGAGSGPCAPG
nr:CvpA family protein [Actinomycetota bacterium]